MIVRLKTICRSLRATPEGRVFVLSWIGLILVSLLIMPGCGKETRTPFVKEMFDHMDRFRGSD